MPTHLLSTYFSSKYIANESLACNCTKSIDQAYILFAKISTSAGAFSSPNFFDIEYQSPPP